MALDRRWPAHLATVLGGVGTAALGVWLSHATVVALPSDEGLVDAVLRWPTLASAAAAMACAGVSVMRRSFWPVLIPLAATVAPLMVPWPPATWVFAGPGVVVIWLFWAGGLAWPLPRPSSSAWTPRAHTAAALVLGVVWLGALTVGVGPFAMSGDAPHYLTITQSLLDDGDVDLKNNYDDRTYQTFYQGSLEPRHTNRSPWGEDYSFHGPGVSFLIAPGVALYGAAGAAAILVVLMALGAGLVWHTTWLLTQNVGAAWFGWASLLLSAPYALHAAAIYPDGPAAVAVAGALWLLARLQARAALPLRMLALGSLGLAVLPWLHVRLAMAAGVLGAAILVSVLTHQPYRWTRAAWFLMVPMVSAAGWFASAYVMFGTWNPAEAMLQRTAPGSWTSAPAGLLGLLADQEHGLFPAAPVMLAAVIAYPGFARARPLIAAGTGILTLGVLGMSSLWVWWGGDSAPARFLTVILPALALWLGHYWERAGASARRLLLLALTISAALTVLYATVDGGARAYNFADGRGTVFEALSSSVDVSRALPSLHRTGASASTEFPLALVWLAAVGVIVAGARAVPAAMGEAARWAVTSLLVLACIAAATSIGWSVRGVSGWTPASSARTALRALARSSVAATAGGWPPTPRSPAQLARRLRLTTPESVILPPSTRLHVPNLPAGEYAVRATLRHPETPSPVLTLALGRDAWPYATWFVGAPGPTIVLVADVHSVQVQGASSTEVWLQPLALGQPASPREARRVTRMGPVDVYSMDDDSYVESMGAWTGGDRETNFLISPSRPGLVVVRLEAGPAAIDVQLAGQWGKRALRLEPHASTVVPLAVAEARTAVDLRASVTGGFPASLLGQPSDSRSLGVWIEFDVTPP